MPSMGGMSNPFMSSPSGGSSLGSIFGTPSSSSSDDSINVDDLVKRIDAKIAELEAEEQQEKEKEKEKKEIFSDNKDNEVKDADIVQKDSSMYEDGTSDDAFFDDFFSDD